MKVFDTDDDDPSAHPEPPVRATPPRPAKRQVTVSLLLTVTILVGTVIAVFTIFPERHNELITSTVAAHRATAEWEIADPPDAELRIWARAVLGEPAPLPDASAAATPIGVRSLTILSRRAALVRYRIGDAEVSYLIQRARDIPKRRVRTTSGGDAIEAWRKGPWTIVVVGPAATADRWRPVLGVP
jgi:hypothetical protein